MEGWLTPVIYLKSKRVRVSHFIYDVIIFISESVIEVWSKKQETDKAHNEEELYM